MYRRQILDSRYQSKPTKFWRLESNFLFLLTSSVWLLTSATPIAAQSVTLSVSPPVVEILLAPGKKVEQAFTLQTSGENIEVTPELHFAKPSDEYGHVMIDPSPTLLECGSPSLQECLPLTVKITGPATSPTLTFEAPNTDLPQDVYLALVFRASPLESGVSNLTSLSPAISALILLTINPELGTPVDLDIKDFALPKIHDSWLPLSIAPILENKTGIMIRPQGLYEIISPSGKTVLSLPLYPNLILGNSSRLIQADTPGVKGSHTPGVLSFTPTWSAIGPHTLRLTITTAGGTQITQLEKTLWLLPIRAMVITLTLIIVLLTLFSKRSKYEAKRP